MIRFKPRLLGSFMCGTWADTSGEVETQLPKITEQATWLKRVTSSWCLSLTGLGLRDHGSKAHSKLEELSCL